MLGRWRSLRERSSLLRRGLASSHRLPHTFKPGEFFQVTVARRSGEIHKWLKDNNLLLPVERYHEEHKVVHQEPSRSVGVDIEWKPSRRKGQPSARTSLLQVATHKNALLIQLRYFAPVSTSTLAKATGLKGKVIECERNEEGSRVKFGTKEDLPQSLVQLFCSMDVVKVGVGILEDLRKLQRDFAFPIGAYRDIGLTARRVLGLEKFGLAALTYYCFKVELLKSKKISRSNWEKAALSFDQIHYAAQDALISRLVFDHLTSQGLYNLENIDTAVSNIQFLASQGSRQSFRRAVLAASESDVLFKKLHHYVRNEDVSKFDTKQPICFIQALNVYCDRLNTSAAIRVRCHNPYEVEVLLHGAVVKTYSDLSNHLELKRERCLSKVQKTKIINGLCREVLDDLLLLQRECVENRSFSLLGIFSNVEVHMLPHSQLQKSKQNRSARPSENGVHNNLEAVEPKPPSFLFAYCKISP